ncbi:TolC family protein [Halosquirtibacter xylanolyticus]|uniref:TolC family protein n=1 Tax=Halosquirtibacter xylanolyticus TaxID=3374599 RepID=UPI003748A9A4|nr:TolC family protein [Prolixibacteraceae bacterium]
MMKAKYIIVALFLFIVSVADAQRKIDRDVCRQSTLTNSEEIGGAEGAYRKAIYKQKEMRSNYLPKIKATGSYMYSFADQSSVSWNDTFMPTSHIDPATQTMVPNLLLDPSGKPIVGADGNPLFSQYAMLPAGGVYYDFNHTFMADITATQPIYMGGKIRQGNHMADLGVALYNLNKQKTQEEMILECDKNYWNFIAVTEQVKVAKMYLSLIDSLQLTVKQAVEVGLKHRNELLKVEVQRNSALLELQEVENQKELIRMSLCRVMGLELNEQLEAKDSLIDITNPTITMRDAVISKRADYRMLKKRDEIKSSNEKVVASDFLPSIGMSAGAYYLGALNVENMGSSNLIKEGWVQNAVTPSIGVKVSIPLCQWGEGRNRIRQAQMETEMAQLETKKQVRMMELEVKQASLNLQQAYSRSMLAQKSVEQAALNMRMSKEAYDQGLELLTDYLEAQTVWQKQYTLFVYSKANYKIEETKYLKSIGELVIVSEP